MSTLISQQKKGARGEKFIVKGTETKGDLEIKKARSSDPKSKIRKRRDLEIQRSKNYCTSRVPPLL